MILGFDVAVLPLLVSWELPSHFLHVPHFLQAGKSILLLLCEWSEEILDPWVWGSRFCSRGAMDVFLNSDLKSEGM